MDVDAELRRRFPNRRVTKQGVLQYGKDPEGEPLYEAGEVVFLARPLRIEGILKGAEGEAVSDMLRNRRARSPVSEVFPAGTRVRVLYPCDHYENTDWHYRCVVQESPTQEIHSTLTASHLRKDLSAVDLSLNSLPAELRNGLVRTLKKRHWGQRAKKTLQSRPLN